MPNISTNHAITYTNSWYFNQGVKIQLLINGHKLDQVKETVFLGVMLDENLNWKWEISLVANKVSKFVGIIRKSSFYTCRQNL